MEPPTGGSTCRWEENNAPTVDRSPRVGMVNLEHVRIGGKNWVHGWDPAETYYSQKQRRRPGNERRFGRVGQPLGSRRIKAPLTLGGGGPSRLKKGCPLGRRRKMMGVAADGRWMIRDSQSWERRSRPERSSDRPIPMTPRWGHPIPVSRGLDRGMRPAKDIQSVRKGNRDVRARGVQEPLTPPLSPLAESFNPQPTSEKQQNQRQQTDNDLDRSPARTGLGETETPWDSIQNEVATIGTAKPIEIGKPVAMADVAVPRGPAGTGAGGPVIKEISMTTVTDRTEASGPRRSETGAPVVTELRSQTGNDRIEANDPAVTVAGGSVSVAKKFRPAGEIAETGVMTGTGTGGPVVTGTRFLAVAEVHAPIAETKGDQWSNIINFDQITEVNTEMTSPNQLEHTSARGGSVVRIDRRGNGMAENGYHFLNPDVIRGTSDKEPVLDPFMCSSNKEIEVVDTVSTEDPTEGDTIMVGVVGSAAPWFLTGWTNDVEVEFMIDTGCQVTILATSVFDRMCDIHPEVRNGLVPCTQRLVSADSSPLTVMGRINLNVVFPGLRVICGV